MASTNSANPGRHLHLVPAASTAIQCVSLACKILTPELAQKLSAINSVYRSLRNAGVRIEAMVVQDVTLFIEAGSADLLAVVFREQWQGVCWSTLGRKTRNMVTIDGVRVVWFTPVRKQDQ